MCGLAAGVTRCDAIRVHGAEQSDTAPAATERRRTHHPNHAHTNMKHTNGAAATPGIPAMLGPNTLALRRTVPDSSSTDRRAADHADKFGSGVRPICAPASRRVM